MLSKFCFPIKACFLRAESKLEKKISHVLSVTDNGSASGKPTGHHSGYEVAPRLPGIAGSAARGH